MSVLEQTSFFLMTLNGMNPTILRPVVIGTVRLTGIY